MASVYDKIKKLGEGGFGQVFLASRGDQKVAIKSYKFNQSNGVSPEIIREICCLKKCNHPNLIKLIDIKLTDTIEIVLEFGGCNLKQYGNSLSLYEKTNNFDIIYKQLISALTYLHQSKIVHRDIKPANILIDSQNMLVKICDFGLSKIIQQKNTIGVGTLNYRAPEVYTGIAYNESVDIWSLGCCLYEFITNQQLFKGSTEIAVINSIMKIVPTTIETLTKIGLSIISIDHCNLTKYHRFPALYDDSVNQVDQRKTLDKIRNQIEQMVVLDFDNRPKLTTSPINPQDEPPNKPIYSDAFNLLIEKFNPILKFHNYSNVNWNFVNYIYTKSFNKINCDTQTIKKSGFQHPEHIFISSLCIASKYLDIKYLKYKTLVKQDFIRNVIEWELYCLKACDWNIINMIS